MHGRARKKQAQWVRGERNISREGSLSGLSSPARNSACAFATREKDERREDGERKGEETGHLTPDLPLQKRSKDRPSHKMPTCTQGDRNRYPGKNESTTLTKIHLGLNGEGDKETCTKRLLKFAQKVG